MKKGKMANSDGIALLNKTTMKGLKEGESYKYLGVIQAGHEMKEKVKTEYYRRVRKILETKLNGGNIIAGINTWAVLLLRYSAAFLDWAGAILGLERYILTSEEGLVIVTTRVDEYYEQHLGMIESVKEFKGRRRNEQSNALKQKKLHGQFFN